MIENVMHGMLCSTYWVGRLCSNNSHTRKYRINVKCEMRNKCEMQHIYNINAKSIHFTKIPSRRREAAAGWDLPICTYVASMLHFRAECMFVAFPNYLHFAFVLYFIYLGKTGQANRIGHIFPWGILMGNPLGL